MTELRSRAWHQSHRAKHPAFVQKPGWRAQSEEEMSTDPHVGYWGVVPPSPVPTLSCSSTLNTAEAEKEQQAVPTEIVSSSACTLTHRKYLCVFS